jgi:hypothetical protein
MQRKCKENAKKNIWSDGEMPVPLQRIINSLIYKPLNKQKL